MLHKLSAVNQKHFSIFLNFPLFPFEENKRIITISNNHLKRGWNHRCFEKIFSPIFFFFSKRSFNFCILCKRSWNLFSRFVRPTMRRRVKTIIKAEEIRAYTQRHRFRVIIFFFSLPISLIAYIYSLFLSFVISYFRSNSSIVAILFF